MYAVTALYYSCGLSYGTKGKHYAYYLAQEFLETTTNFEKQTFDIWKQNHTYRETQRQQGQDPWWPTVEKYKAAIESRGEDQTPYYIVSPPRGLRQRTKTSHQQNTGKHQKPQQRKTLQKRLRIDTEGK